MFLALKLQRPLLLEGEAGVGKTEVAKVLAAALDTRPDPAAVLRRPRRQPGGLRMELRAPAARDPADGSRAAPSIARRRRGELFDARFLIKRPLLQALSERTARAAGAADRRARSRRRRVRGVPARAAGRLPDHRFPSSERSARQTPPIVIITSNRTRELHDALKRRCLYFWIDLPDFDKELRIVTAKVPQAPRRLAEQVTAFVQELRAAELYKPAGVSETLDWVAALVALDRDGARSRRRRPDARHPAEEPGGHSGGARRGAISPSC